MCYNNLILLFLLLIILFSFNFYSVYRNSRNIFEGLENSKHIEEPKACDKKKGIRREDIPPGEHDIWVRKTTLVPPVCPKCPSVINKCNTDDSKCPPCPPCGRCPKPEFECKKVPIYQGDSLRRVMPFLNNPPMTPLQR